MPELAPLKSIEELLLDAQRLMQNQMAYFCKDRAGEGLAAVLTAEELNAVSLVVRTLKTIQSSVPDGASEDLSKLSSAEIERRMKSG